MDYYKIILRYFFPIIFSVLSLYFINKIIKTHSDLYLLPQYNISIIALGILVLLTIMTIVVSFYGNELKKSILLFLIVIGICSYSLEFYLYFDNVNPDTKKYLKKKISNYDNRTLFQVLDDYDKDKTIVPFLSPDNFISDRENKDNLFALSGISNTTTLHCNELGYYSVYQSDMYGFNNPNKLWKDKKDKIILLGDSFVHGSCVNYEDTIAGNLNNLQKNYSVLNLGYSGNGPLRSLATLVEYFEKTNAKHIFWFYYEENELTDNIYGELRHPLLRQYLNSGPHPIITEKYSQNLINKQYLIDQKLNFFLKEFIDNLKKHSKKRVPSQYQQKKKRDIIFFKHLREAIGHVLMLRVPEKNIEIFSTILDRSQEVLLSKNSKLYFVYLPSQFRYVKNHLNNQHLYNYKKIKQIVQEKNIELIDYRYILNKEENPLDYWGGGHLNERGYKLLAEYISNRIK